MKRAIPLIILAFLLVFVAVFPVGAQEKPLEKAPVFLISVKSIINPATAKFITDSIDEAVKQGGQCLIIQLDTPGGLDTSMREATKAILGARRPRHRLGGTPGARAASAGVFITMAAHIAAMAPGTNIGAAHPVSIGGSQRRRIPTMAAKVVNDAVAYARAIAQTRGRNADWFERAIRESVSIDAEGAVREGICRS